MIYGSNDEQITLDLEKKINLLELDVTLVFDSHYQKDDHTRSHFNSLEIIFTASGETADEFILQELKESKTPSQHIVITSDKKLARLCQLRLSKTESVEEFLAWLGKRYKNKLRQKPLLTPKLIQPNKIEELIKLPLPTLPTPLKSAEDCFDYYQQIFEKEFLITEQKKGPQAKKNSPEPKKPKIKKRKLTKEETQLSDWQRWQNAFENKSSEDSDDFVF